MDNLVTTNDEEMTENQNEDEMQKMDETGKTGECPLKLKLKIYETITTRILPQLHKCLTKKV